MTELYIYYNLFIHFYILTIAYLIINTLHGLCNCTLLVVQFFQISIIILSFVNIKDAEKISK